MLWSRRDVVEMCSRLVDQDVRALKLSRFRKSEMIVGAVEVAQYMSQSSVKWKVRSSCTTRDEDDNLVE